MGCEHHVVICPGMAKNTCLPGLTDHWVKSYGLFPDIVPIQWFEGNFQSKLDEVVAKIDDLMGNGHKVSLIGISAGGCVALNAFIERGEINKMVNICGPLWPVTKNDLNTFVKASVRSSVFGEYSQRLNELKDKLKLTNRKKILTISVKNDELVSRRAVLVRGALNVQIPKKSNHIEGIVLALSFRDPLFPFLLDSRK